MTYDHKISDSKWQKNWTDNKDFLALDPDQTDKPKYYVLSMFPYPSGKGLHVGHLASYTPPDVVARFKRLKGFNVLNPMGYDAFGLPAEQHAIQTGEHPEKTTQVAIENFRRQLKSYGFSFDWDKEISTCDPSFYKWTQYIFGILHKKGLAYQKEVPVNWCPALKTVLANEEVVNGKSERGGHPVIRRPMKQWMLKITDYAEKLLQDLDTVNWPKRTIEGQKNWIGKSVGAEVTFITTTDHKFEVFTTRPDTLFGATFMVLAPEHPLVKKITTSDQLSLVEDYIKQTSSKSDIERKATTEKSGAFTGAYAKHPLNNEDLPIWISDYVLMDYGHGAVMAVPAHDERDFEFATKYELPIKRVLETENELPDPNDGILINSDFLNGLEKVEAIQKMILKLEAKKIGVAKTTYKLRDWLFSRQRFWGEPIPILHKKDGSSRSLEINELPLMLPEVEDFEPTENGEAPLARVRNWVETSEGFRETHTMPGSAGSSWYFLRYIDPHNPEVAFSAEKEKYWMPVDLYMGGAEHTVGHLLYARFWQKVLFDAGLVTTPEPFQRLAHQGLILGPDGEKMSKSRGNTVNTDEVKDLYGADAVRLYICFLGPYDRDKPWSTQGIEGSKRFLDRVYRWVAGTDEVSETNAEENKTLHPDLEKLFHKSVKKITEDIENLSFNTAISTLMILVNQIYKTPYSDLKFKKDFLRLLSPFAPHVCDELGSLIDKGSTQLISQSTWPTFDESLCVDDMIILGVQVNGKMRGKIELSPTALEPEALELATKLDAVQAQLVDKSVRKVIYKPARILNIIVG